MDRDEGLLEIVRALYCNLAVIMDQIDSCGPTEMIGAAFDGRELETARHLIAQHRELVYGKYLSPSPHCTPNAGNPNYARQITERNSRAQRD